MASQRESVEQLFEAALALTPTERDAFLDMACANDPGLRRVVEELLAADVRAGSFLQHPPLEFLDQAKMNPHQAATGTFSPSTSTGRMERGQILIDRFVIVRLIAKGGMGEVYEAEDRFLQGVHVALKILLPHIAADPALQRRFEREVLLARKLTHPNLCPIYDISHCEQPPGFLFFTMKLLPGQTLGARLQGPTPISIEEGLAILKQLASGLAAIHDAGIVHRDIKPGNIMLEGAGPGVQVCITDFGLARAYETETTMSSQGTLAGTPGYFAPELFLGQLPSRASDLFAFGVVLHEIFTHHKPAMSPDNSGVTVSPGLHSSGAPSYCVQLVSGCLDSDPRRRCQAFEEALESLGLRRRTGKSWIWHGFAGSAARRTTLRVGMAAALAVFVVAGFAMWSAGIPHWLHTANGAATAGVPATQYDQFLKAQELLEHSYKEVNIAAAVSGFQEVLKADPNFALAQAGLGQAYFLQYRNNSDAKLLDMAKQATAKALQLDANLASPYITMARMAAMQGHTQLAMQQVQKAIALDPHSAEAYGALAEVYQTDGRTKDALAAAQQAIDLAPDDSRWPVRLGDYLIRAGNPKEAASQFHRAVELSKDNPMAFYDLGVVNAQLGNLGEAEADLRESAKLEAYVDTYSGLGSVLELEGKLDDSATLSQKAIELDPGNFRAWGNLAGAYLWGGRREQAMQAYHKAIELALAKLTKSPNDSDLLIQIADYYASVGQGEKSLVYLRKAIALSPDDPNINYGAGETYEIMGQRAKAIPLLARSLAQGYHATEVQRSPELAALRSDPAFQSALTKAKIEYALGNGKKLN